MSDVEIVLNSDGITELLKDSGVVNLLQQHADEIQGRAGTDYEGFVKTMPTRPIAIVETANIKGIRDNLKHNTLAKAMR